MEVSTEIMTYMNKLIKARFVLFCVLITSPSYVPRA